MTTYAADEAADGYSLMDCLPNSALLTEESVEIGDFDSASMAQFNNSECEGNSNNHLCCMCQMRYASSDSLAFRQDEGRMIMIMYKEAKAKFT